MGGEPDGNEQRRRNRGTALRDSMSVALALKIENSVADSVALALKIENTVANFVARL